MINVKGTTVYNKGQKIKEFEDEEDAESFKNALQMMEKKTVVKENNTQKLYTSINEFKQYLNEEKKEKTELKKGDYILYGRNKEPLIVTSDIYEERRNKEGEIMPFFKKDRYVNIKTYTGKDYAMSIKNISDIIFIDKSEYDDYVEKYKEVDKKERRKKKKDDLAYKRHSKKSAKQRKNKQRIDKQQKERKKRGEYNSLKKLPYTDMILNEYDITVLDEYEISINFEEEEYEINVDVEIDYTLYHGDVDGGVEIKSFNFTVTDHKNNKYKLTREQELMLKNKIDDIIYDESTADMIGDYHYDKWKNHDY